MSPIAARGISRFARRGAPLSCSTPGGRALHRRVHGHGARSGGPEFRTPAVFTFLARWPAGFVRFSCRVHGVFFWALGAAVLARFVRTVDSWPFARIKPRQLTTLRSSSRMHRSWTVTLGCMFEKLGHLGSCCVALSDCLVGRLY